MTESHEVEDIEEMLACQLICIIYDRIERALCEIEAMADEGIYNVEMVEKLRHCIEERENDQG